MSLIDHSVLKLVVLVSLYASYASVFVCFFYFKANLHISESM